MILLEANPLDDIAHMSRISGVVLRGRYFDRGELDKIVDDVAASSDGSRGLCPPKIIRPNPGVAGSGQPVA